MFSHIMLGTDDIERSKAFYDAALGALGVKPGRIDPKGRVSYVGGGGVLMLSKPIDGKSSNGGNGSTIGFAAQSSAEVDAWHQAGLAHGGTAIEDAPGMRSNGTMSLYLAYLRDPGGNKVCAMYRPAS